MEKEVLKLLAQVQGIAQSGKTYGYDVYDLERYEQLLTIYQQLMAHLTDLPLEKINVLSETDEGYATPKVDIRAVVFDSKERLLLVQEKKDQTWALPGGWADIGFSPFEVAAKETLEEAGIHVIPKKLLAVKDKAKHAYPPSASYVYKFFILCEPESIDVHGGVETSQAKFFDKKNLTDLPLSLERNTLKDLQECFKSSEEETAVYCD